MSDYFPKLLFRRRGVTANDDGHGAPLVTLMSHRTVYLHHELHRVGLGLKREDSSAVEGVIVSATPVDKTYLVISFIGVILACSY